MWALRDTPSRGPPLIAPRTELARCHAASKIFPKVLQIAPEQLRSLFSPRLENQMGSMSRGTRDPEVPSSAWEVPARLTFHWSDRLFLAITSSTVNRSLGPSGSPIFCANQSIPQPNLSVHRLL